MKNICVTICICTFSLFAQWEVKTVEPINTLNWVHFLDTSRGFIVGNQGSIYKTTDGGISWQFSLIDPLHVVDLFCIQFVNDSLAWISGRYGSLFRSTDGGQTWKYEDAFASTFGGYYLTQIQFFNLTKGFVMGSSKFIYKTNSAGEGWCFTPSGFTSKFQKIQMLDESVGYVNGDSGKACKTTDGGDTWVPMQTGVNNTLNSLEFLNNSIGFMIGFEGTILKTTNGGANWNKYLEGPNEYLSTVRFPTDSIGWITGANGLILKSSNTGTTWVKQTTNTTKSFIGSFFLGNNHGWAVGESGTVVRYIPNSTTQVMNKSNLIEAKFELLQSFPNPFNPTTLITFSIPVSEKVELKIFDVLGKEIQTLVDKYYNPGTYTVEFNSKGLASGTYIYRLQSGKDFATQKMVLTK